MLDTESVIAYYCFVNHGKFPSEYLNLPFREKALVTAFALKEIADREEAKKR